MPSKDSKIISARVPKEVNFDVSVSKILSSVYFLAQSGVISIGKEGVLLTGVYPIDCDNCPYVTDLNMNGFDEVCEFKDLDRQKALDKCVQMLWR